MAADKGIDKNEVKKDYLEGMKYKDIASKYGVALDTVKAWVKRYGWSKERCTQKNKKKCTQNKNKGTPNKKGAKEEKKAIAEDVKQVLANEDLTDKQKLFCLYYVKCFNATKAYLKAYQGTYNTANVEGWKLLVNPRVKAEIESLKQNKLNRAFLSEDDILQKYIDIAFADMTEFIEFGKKPVKVCYEDGSTEEVEKSYIDFKNDFEVDGSIISEVSKGKDGVKVKLLDKMKALDVLREMYEMNPEFLHRKNIDLEKIKLEKERLEHVKAIDELKNF